MRWHQCRHPEESRMAGQSHLECRLGNRNQLCMVYHRLHPESGLTHLGAHLLTHRRGKVELRNVSVLVLALVLVLVLGLVWVLAWVLAQEVAQVIQRRLGKTEGHPQCRTCSLHAESARNRSCPRRRPSCSSPSSNQCLILCRNQQQGHHGQGLCHSCL